MIVSIDGVYFGGGSVDDKILGLVKGDGFDGRSSLSAIDSFVEAFIVGLELNNLIECGACKYQGHVEAILYTLLLLQQEMGPQEKVQKQPDRVTPPHTIIIIMQITTRTATKMPIRIFQFYHIIARFIVFVELFMSSESEAIVYVLRTKMSNFYSRSRSFCKSQFIIWFTYYVYFHSFATLSTSYGELQSSIFPLSLFAKSIAPYICIFCAVYKEQVERKVLRILSRQEKAILSEYLISAMTKYMRSQQSAQKMQLLAENLEYFLLGVHLLRICCAVRTKLPLQGVNSASSISPLAITVQISDILSIIHYEQLIPSLSKNKRVFQITLLHQLIHQSSRIQSPVFWFTGFSFNFWILFYPEKIADIQLQSSPIC